MSSRMQLDESILDAVAGGSFGVTDADGDGAGTIYVYYTIDGKKVAQTGVMKYDNWSAVSAFISAHAGMDQVEIFNAMAAAGIIHG